MTIKVNFLGPKISDHPTGIENYTVELGKAIQSYLKTHSEIPIEVNYKAIQIEVKEFRLGRIRFGGFLSVLLQMLTQPRPEGMVHAMSGGWSYGDCDVITVHDILPSKLLWMYQRRLKEAISINIENRSMFGARHLITATESVKDDMVKYFGHDPRNITVIPYGINLDFYGILPGVQKALHSVLFVGDDNPKKNLPKIVEAIGLAGLTRGRALMFFWAGKSKWPDEYQKIKATVRKFGIDFRELGYVSNEQLRDLYNKVSATLFLPVDEGMGLPPLESLACGTPVVVSAIPAFSHLDDRQGEKANPYDVFDMANAINRVLRLPWARKALRESVLKYTWAEAAKRTIEVYLKVANGRQ